MNRHPDLDLADEALREWAWYFRDRRPLGHCRSIEHRFKATSDDFGPDGWGDEEAAPRTSPARSYSVLRAEFTHQVIQGLDRVYRWALTYGYCYPGLPRFVVLRCMRKFTGRRLNWGQFCDLLDLGRLRVQSTISLTRLNFPENLQSEVKIQSSG